MWFWLTCFVLCRAKSAVGNASQSFVQVDFPKFPSLILSSQHCKLYLLKCNMNDCAVPPFLRYGKYCGLLYSGCPGEKPCDGLDACCMKHDACVQAKNSKHNKFFLFDKSKIRIPIFASLLFVEIRIVVTVNTMIFTKKKKRTECWTLKLMADLTRSLLKRDIVRIIMLLLGSTIFSPFSFLCLIMLTYNSKRTSRQSSIMWLQLRL